MLMTAKEQLAKRLGCRIAISHIRPFGEHVDVVIDISGFAYSSQPRWGRRWVKSAIAVREAHPNATWYFLPQSFGPFEEDIADDCRRLFHGAFVVARDEVSWKHLEQLNANIELRQATDITWAFAGLPERGVSLLREIGVDPEKPVIGIGPNMRVKEARPEYLNCLVRLVEQCRAWGQVVLVPHEIGDSARDDRALCKLLDAPALLGAYSAKELKGVLAHCDMLVGSRYHGLMGAISQGVPCVAIGWADKYQTLLSELSLAEYCVNQFSDANDIMRKCWENRHQVSSHLNSVARSKRTEVAKLFDDIGRRIKNDSKPPPTGLDASLRLGVRQNRAGRGNYFNFRRNVHRLEKGLMAHARSVAPRSFASGYIDETLCMLERFAIDPTFDEETLKWGLDTLGAYFNLHPNSPLNEKFKRLENQTRRPIEAAPYPASSRPETSISIANLAQLCRRRRSIRYFEDRVPPQDLVVKCIELAMQSPSACNRQAFRFQYYDDPAEVDRIAKIPFGVRDLSLPGLLVIIGSYEGYFDARDIKCPIIDASLAAMSLMLALETVGLSSLPINFPELPKFRAEAAQACGLGDSEIVVMLMAIGFADPNGLVAVSRKRSVEQVLKINPRHPTSSTVGEHR